MGQKRDNEIKQRLLKESQEFQQKEKKVSVTFVKTLGEPQLIKGKLRTNINTQDKISLKSFFKKSHIVRFKASVTFRKGKTFIRSSSFSQYAKLSGSNQFKRKILEGLKNEALSQAIINIVNQLDDLPFIESGISITENTAVSKFYTMNKNNLTIRTNLQIMKE